ncbi:hypothetical protein N9M41_06560 [Rhodopirellula sp.]|nr:hypothetical protein [Rhodopirellula sp.]
MRALAAFPTIIFVTRNPFRVLRTGNWYCFFNSRSQRSIKKIQKKFVVFGQRNISNLELHRVKVIGVLKASFQKPYTTVSNGHHPASS